MKEQQPKPPPTHSLPLGGGWRLWRELMVRGAGFPAADVLRLSGVKSIAAADSFFALEARVGEFRTRAIEVLDRLLHERKGTERKPFARALKKLSAGRAIETIDGLEEASREIQELQAAEAALDATRRDLDAIYREQRLATSRSLKELADEPRLREAMIWQNRRAALRVIRHIRSAETLAATKLRAEERTIACYLQRYCTKNDTIGFFGPIGWGRLGDDARALEVFPGPGLVTHRQVFFERWAIDQLASVLMRDEGLRPHLAPRRMPTARLDGNLVHLADGRTVDVPEDVSDLLAACSGEESAETIAKKLLDQHDFEMVEEVYELLEQLVAAGLITWTLEIPSRFGPCEELLIELLEHIGDEAIRERAKASVANLLNLKDCVSQAAGDPEQLEAALSGLDASFAELTGTDAVRRSGQMYAGRTLVYEDCCRDLDLVLGSAVLDRLRPVLPMILNSARRFTAQVAAGYRRRCIEVYDQVSEGAGDPVPYIAFWRELASSFADELYQQSDIVAGAERENVALWEELLQPDPTIRRIELTPEELQDRASELFEADGPGWPSARHISPDILLAARSVDDINNGDYVLVLGETHVGNTLLARFSLQSHVDPESLIAMEDRDIPGVRVTPVETPASWSRAALLSYTHEGNHLELGRGKSWKPRSKVLAAADLVVIQEDGLLWVRDADQRHSIEISAFLEQYLKFAAWTSFGILKVATHLPRITVGGVVLVREQWRFDPEDLTFARHPDGAEQFLEMQRWAKAHGIPRWFFVKIPEETKPVFVDLASPICAEILSRLLRKASTVVVSEMLPTVEDTWLRDANGRTFTSELRLVAVDPLPWRPPPNLCEEGKITR